MLERITKIIFEKSIAMVFSKGMYGSYEDFKIDRHLYFAMKCPLWCVLKAIIPAIYLRSHT